MCDSESHRIAPGAGVHACVISVLRRNWQGSSARGRVALADPVRAGADMHPDAEEDARIGAAAHAMSPTSPSQPLRPTVTARDGGQASTSRGALASTDAHIMRGARTSDATESVPVPSQTPLPGAIPSGIEQMSSACQAAFDCMHYSVAHPATPAQRCVVPTCSQRDPA